LSVEAAIANARKAGKALCKFISRNDVGVTGGHQCGFYLPKSAWRMFTTQAPVKGVNHKAIVEVIWPQAIRTQSAVTWYGTGTRSEYRLTRFGRDFPWLWEGYVGSLLVIIPFSLELFHAHVLETDEDIETFEAALGVETIGGWGIFEAGQPPKTETEDECLERVFRDAVATITEFPSGARMAELARAGVEECVKAISRLSADDKLLRWAAAEFQLFRSVERKICLPDVQRSFADIDEFLGVASPIIQRRKSRAGRSLERHVEYLLEGAGVPFDRQPRIDGKVTPDLLIPGRAAYEDSSFPTSRLLIVGVKRTCKDRWRQILNEGKRIPVKHLLTIQEAISSEQLLEMKDANVTLVVPKAYHKDYDASVDIKLLSIEEFISASKAATCN
jgi:hypothetical protein